MPIIVPIQKHCIGLMVIINTRTKLDVVKLWRKEEELSSFANNVLYP